MSAILSADDLNDFISPGVACIKPIEALPAAPEPSNPYEVQQEDKSPAPRTAAQISLTDCLACSGCVTSAEAVLVQLQSGREVLDNLLLADQSLEGHGPEKVFVALLSPQTTAALSATFGVSPREVRNMVGWLLGEGSGVGVKGRVLPRQEEGEEVEEDGSVKIEKKNPEVETKRGGKGFRYIIDTDVGRDVALVYAYEEVNSSIDKCVAPSSDDTTVPTKKPILTSACPGFICYAESTHPYLIPHLSRLKSPQAILGTFVKTVLPKILAEEKGLEKPLGPESVYVVGIQPCFDKKLEGARGELTSAAWGGDGEGEIPVRDVDCVITTRELVTLAAECGVDFASLPRTEPPTHISSSQNPELSSAHQLLLSTASTAPSSSSIASSKDISTTPPGTSGAYLHYILSRLSTASSTLTITPGRNPDTIEYILTTPDAPTYKLARSYGFRNIQNLVRKLKPADKRRRALPQFGRVRATPMSKPVAKKEEEQEYVYVEVMACPGGCTNGGGQIKVDDELLLQAINGPPGNQKEWLAKVDEAYWSGSESHMPETSSTVTQQAPAPVVNDERVKSFVKSWAAVSGVGVRELLFTGYRKVEDEFSAEAERKRKEKENPIVRAAELAGKAGGGW